MSDTESVDLYQISVARDGSDYHELLVDDNKARAKKENGDGADTQSQSASQAQDEEKLPNGQKSTKRPREGSAEPQEGAGNDVAGDDFQLHPDTLWSDDERDDADHPAKRQAIGATGEGKSAAPAPARKRTGNTSAANAATTTAAAAAAALESFAVRTVVTRKDVDVIFEHEAGSKERLEQQKGVSISIIAGKDDPEIVVDRVVVVKGPIDGVCAAYLHIAEAMLEIKEAATRKREEDKKAGVSTEADAAADPHDHDADDSDDENKDDKDDDDNEKAAEASTGAEDATAPKAAEGEATAAPKAEKAEKTAKTEKTPAGPRLTLRILVPNRCIGIIMGHGGATINRIRDESGVNIRTSESMLPHSSERIVALIGAPPAIAKAIKLMAKVLVEDLANYSTNDYYVPAVNLPSAMTVNMSNRRTKPLNQRSRSGDKRYHSHRSGQRYNNHNSNRGPGASSGNSGSRYNGGFRQGGAQDSYTSGYSGTNRGGTGGNYNNRDRDRDRDRFSRPNRYSNSSGGRFDYNDRAGGVGRGRAPSNIQPPNRGSVAPRQSGPYNYRNQGNGMRSGASMGGSSSGGGYRNSGPAASSYQPYGMNNSGGSRYNNPMPSQVPMGSGGNTYGGNSYGGNSYGGSNYGGNSYGGGSGGNVGPAPYPMTTPAAYAYAPPMQPMYNPGPGQSSGGGYQNQRPFNSRSGGGVGGGGGGSGGRPHMSGPMHSGGPDGRYQPGPANAGNTIQQLYIPADKVGILIGRKGETINGIRRATNAEVEIQNADPGSRNRLIIITGREPCVRSAYTMIKDKVANSHPGGQW